jgi:hypothetical protein
MNLSVLWMFDIVLVILMCGLVGVLSIYQCTLVSVFEMSYVACNSGLSFHLPFVSFYFPIVFTRFRITVYPATVFVPGCPTPATVSVKKI